MNTFKNLLLGAALGILAAALPAFADDETGFKNIFNGTDLSGWDGDPAFWSVKDGAITGQTTPENPAKGNTFILWRDGMTDDFELRTSYRLISNNDDKFGNSGIQYRSKHEGNWVVGGYQADMECGKTYSGILYEERGRGILAQRGQKVTIDKEGQIQVTGSVGDSSAIESQIKPGDWNEYVIIAQGNHLIHKINGNVTVDITDEQVSKRARSGVLALQLHAGKAMMVQFKNIRLKRLPLGDARKIVMVAGGVSHGPGDHEHNAGIALWKHCLDQVPGVIAQAYLNNAGWPKDVTAFDNADAIVFFMDGGDGNALIQNNHLETLEGFMKNGVGLACVHYTVEVPKAKGGAELTRWIGGFYETGFSTNPTWDADFTALPEHPITHGVKPFKLNDEWYYNIRFPGEQSGFTPILKATPPDPTRGTAAAKENPGRSEILAWAKQRSDGGRGFGYTGGHFHKLWFNEDCRKLLLNAFLWTAKAEVPADGVNTKLEPEDVKFNLENKDDQHFTPAPWLPK